MSAILGTAVTGAGGGAYTIDNSLRFRASASAYLNRTPVSAGNTQIFTQSFWLKRGKLATGQWAGVTVSGSASYGFFFDTNDILNVYVYYTGSVWQGQLITTQVFRDPSAWYHFVLAVDTTQATNTNRIKLYVNGNQVTAFSTANYPNQNQTTNFNTAAAHFINQLSSSSYGDCYLAEVNWIDGQALTPSSFGATDANTGVWQPKAYAGSYGTNGFYLKFSDIATTSGSNAGLGKDFSGNANYWNTNNISVTAGVTYDAMTDSPTPKSSTVGNYGVFNPLNKFSSTTITNGNLLVTNGSSGDGWSTTGSTFAFPQTGKWYAEFTIVNRPFSGTTGIGIVPSNISFVNQSGDSARFAWGRVYFDNSGIIGPNNASVQNTTQAPTYTTGDIISVAFDSDNGTVWWAKNGTWTNSGNPATGANPAYTGLTAAAFPMGFVITSEGYSSSQITGNWGQQPFTYTPPSGFVALNTFNLPTPTIGATASTQANDYFNAVLYTGTGSSQSITGLDFQPDLVWIKSRNNAGSNHLIDAVRGIPLFIFSDSTAGDTSRPNSFTSFNSNGFTVGSSSDGNTNLNTYTYVAWNWKANGSGSTNTAGTITSTVSANTTAGFSIVTYTGNGTNATVGHGLGASPSFIIVKKRSASDPWPTYHVSLGVQFYTLLDSTAASYNNLSNYWGSTAPSSTVFGLGPGYGGNNSNGSTYVAYCFAPIAGYSAFGSYTGNGSSDGPFIFTGFRPEFVMIKNANAVTDWKIMDAARNLYNPETSTLAANTSGSEDTNSSYAIDYLSNGFKIRNTFSTWNGSGNTLIYMAFAESPFKYANAR